MRQVGDVSSQPIRWVTETSRNASIADLRNRGEPIGLYLLGAAIVELDVDTPCIPSPMSIGDTMAAR